MQGLDKNIAADSRWFYRDIPAVPTFEDAAHGLGQMELPDDWWIVVADVVGSTVAIEAGRYKDVNTIGAATIMAVLNVDRSIPIPFIFGGDGATLAVPNCCVSRVRNALLGTQEMSRKSFGLDLRVGLIPVAAVRSTGASTLVGKFFQKQKVFQSSFSGHGWSKAESLLKDPATRSMYEVVISDGCKPDADFSGFECRWEPIPSRRGQKVAIVAQATTDSVSENLDVYRNILKMVRQIFGDVKDMHPLFESGMKLSVNPFHFLSEIRVRTASSGLLAKIIYICLTSLSSIFSKIAFPLKLKTGPFDWGTYRNEVMQCSDFQKFDGMLKMVVDVSDEQLLSLIKWLDGQEKNGRLMFGLFQSPAAIVTCLVFTHSGEHTHFVDGSDGGYAMAAKQFKEKAAARNAPKYGGAA